MNKKLLGGFTLIELLIVMAILGVLAVVVLVAINPVQQLARTRDAGRKSGIGQIGRALEAYYTSHNGSYMPATGGTFLNVLSTSGEISTPPSQISFRGGYTAQVTCSNAQSGWCYLSNLAEAVVYTELESQSEQSKCLNTATMFVWSTVDGRGGIVCGTAPANPGTAQGWNSVQ